MKSLDNALDGWTVIAIDDDPDSLEVVSVILSMHGADVKTATNGKDGLMLITELRPDLIISDLSMPNMTGWELVEALNKGDRALANIPVIALTAHAMERDRRLAISAGFTNFITKPLQPEKLVKQVISLLAVDRPELRVFLTENA